MKYKRTRAEALVLATKFATHQAITGVIRDYREAKRDGTYVARADWYAVRKPSNDYGWYRPLPGPLHIRVRFSARDRVTHLTRDIRRVTSGWPESFYGHYLMACDAFEIADPEPGSLLYRR